MNKNILKTLFIIAMTIVLFNVKSYAAGKLDPTIASFSSATLSLNSDGTAHFIPPTYRPGYKRFALQLLKRVSSINGTTVTYTYKTTGGIKYVDSTETEYTFSISSVGYYQFQIRGENLEGNYSEWTMIVNPSGWATYQGVPVTEDDITAGGSSTSGIGSGSSYMYGPGVVQYGYYPYGNQYYVIGPNGEIIYNYAGNQSNNFYTNSQYQGTAVAQGPGYVNNSPYGSSVLSPYTGVSSYPVAPSPFGGTGATNATNTNSQTNPNYYSGVGSYNQGAYNYNQGAYNYNQGASNATGSPQITQGLESGWHVDSRGRYFYQGNGVLLRSTWYLIDGYYYRFGDNGYVLANQWFKDNSTGYWYYLNAEGKMLTGWQKINGAWYYFKAINGNGYGAMYANTSTEITDYAWGTGIYAFDSNGICIMNAWYGGYYYGSDGKRAR